MSESIKFKENTYWDSTSITHNKELLSTKIINSSGSNSNGSWIKFEDGTMICYNTFQATADVSLAWNYIYYGYIEGKKYYAHPFISKPMVQITTDNNETTTFGFSSTICTVTATYIESIPIFRGSKNTWNGYVHVLAIGKWK